MLGSVGVAPLPDDLMRPEAWPSPAPSAVELVETHVSWVFRADRDVIKVKKPLDLGFLDFRSTERRRKACDDEVRLNARLAGATYLGVVPVTRGDDGSLRIGGPGPAVDWGVHMKRLADTCRADSLLARGALRGEQIDRVAEILAGFHASAAVPAEVALRWASPEAVARNVRDNFAQTRALAPGLLPEPASKEVERAQLALLADRASLFEARVDGGFVRDGHGDLRLEHLYFEPDGLRIIDCIEFDERYRVADVCCDVAFLSMDLAAHGRVDLAERLLARYARASDDYDLYALVDFYEGYRAWVRAKVAAIVACDPGAADAVRQRAAAEARRHFALALACNRASLVAPSLVCVGGIIASGKSTVAEALAGDLSCPVVDADRTRKHLLGVSETRRLDDPLWQGAYAPGTTERVYAEVLRRAERVLASGRSVVVDASFRSRPLRAAARRLASARGVRFCFVECRAPLEECRRRVALRRGGPSDGRLEILDGFAESYDAVDEIEVPDHLVLETTRPLGELREAFRDRVATWPARLTA
jgi:aminoglycoside phosphotransferase family enzyme/predicted kinase